MIRYGAMEERWERATWTVVAIWVVLMFRLMIADVWDETNGMLAFNDAAMSLGAKVEIVLTQSVGFWRPLPSLFVVTVLHALPGVDVSWRVLRAVNIILLLAAVHILLRTIEATGALRFVLAVALLFSGSAVITAGWFVNIYDAATLLLIAIAFSLVMRDCAIAAGLVIGAAFFCKETAALALPFLLILFATGRIHFRQLLRAAIPAAAVGAIYFAIRSQIVPFGTEGDVHEFVPSELVPTLINFAESFWRQTLKPAGPALFGFAMLAFSLAMLRRPRVIAATLLFFGATAAIYWGMFNGPQEVLIQHFNFIGRLYLVPAGLLLTILALERRTLAIAVLCIPIVFGGITTWRDHARFQRTYRRIYRIARQTPVKPLRVHLPTKPLRDRVRGIEIDNLADAPYAVNLRTGRVERRTFTSAPSR